MGQPVREGFLDFHGHKTWYRVTGEMDGRKAPVAILHGGPGATHDYLLSLAGLADQGRAVIHYDQLGNGRSCHLPDEGADFWTVDLFLEELENLLTGLGVRDRYHLLGQSWGGMLAAEHAVARPAGMQSLVIADSPASMQLWVREANRLREQLPPEVQSTLLAHERDGTTDDPAYLAATQTYYDRHVCRVVPNPPEVAATFAALQAEPTVYHVMNGPSEFHTVGTLKDWSIIDRLELIQAPTLVISGRYDEATPATVEPFTTRIRGARWEIFEESSHMPHVEETERCLSLVGSFLDQHD